MLTRERHRRRIPFDRLASLLRPKKPRTPGERYRAAVIFWTLTFFALEVKIALWLGMT